jgi:competence protein ComEC
LAWLIKDDSCEESRPQAAFYFGTLGCMRIALLLTISLGFLAGVAWRTLVAVPQSVMLFMLLLAGVLALVWRRNSGAVSSPLPLHLALFFVFASLGVMRTEIAAWQFMDTSLVGEVGQEVMFEGVIVREPDYRQNSVQLTVEYEDELLLVSADRLGSYAYGDLVLVAGELELPEAFETDLGRTFNYPGYLRAKGIEYRVSFAEVEVLGEGQGNIIMSTLLTAKSAFISSLQSVVSEPQAGLGAGLLLGVKSALGDDIEEDFRQTGIIHIVVLSGYNVMLVVAFIMFCFSFFLPLRARVVTGIAAVVAFALIVGLSATVVRASVMAGLVLLSQALGRQYDVLRALILAGLLMVLINPYLLVYDIGFQLSFMATLGLILIIPQFELLGLQEKQWFGAKEFFLATLATQIAVLPLLMYHIGEVSIISLVVNVLVLPVVPVAMLLTFAVGMLGFVSLPLASMVGFIANLSLLYILEVAKWFATLPFAAVTVPAFSPLGVLLLYAAMFGLWYYLQLRQRRTASEYDDWTIETEAAEEPVDSSAASASTPIFFR